MLFYPIVQVHVAAIPKWNNDKTKTKEQEQRSFLQCYIINIKTYLSNRNFPK